MAHSSCLTRFPFRFSNAYTQNKDHYCIVGCTLWGDLRTYRKTLQICVLKSKNELSGVSAAYPNIELPFSLPPYNARLASRRQATRTSSHIQRYYDVGKHGERNKNDANDRFDFDF